MIKIETRQQGSVTIVGVAGEVHSADNDAFSTAMEEVSDRSVPGARVVVDLARLEYLNSRALGDLAALHARLRSRGGKLVLAGASPGVLRVLRFTGLLELLENHPDVAGAVGALDRRAGKDPQ
jgi:anti-anti-sigma factor